MRKLIFIGCVALGAGAGLLIGIAHDSLGLAIFFGLKLMILGMVLGYFVSSIGRKSSVDETAAERELSDQEEWERVARVDGSDWNSDGLVENYWRDKGHPPFMNPENHDPRA